MRMRKLKKLLAGVVAAATVMSTMAMGAFAAGPDTILQKTGSLTINKKEADEAKTPLAGVEFTMYKIADITQSIENGVVDTKATPVDALEEILSADDLAGIAEKETSAEEWNALLAKIGDFEKLEEYASKTTDANGQVKFTDVPIGIYAVAETDAPSTVITKSANFIVSIPMTTDDGDSWEYDVVAEPKNATSRGGISLQKTGTTGASTVPLNGVTFVLQQNVDGEWTTVKEVTTNESGIISVEDLAPGTYRFVEKTLGTNNGGYILDGKSTYEFELRIVNGETHVFINNEDKGTSHTIEVNNEKPTLEKEVKDGEGYDDETDAAIGDTVEWRVTASVPTKVNELKTYKLTDTMSNALTWVSKEAAGLSISAGEAALEEGVDYTLTLPNDNTAGGTWVIEFTESGKNKLKEAETTEIIVTFKTILNENANIGKEGNLNDAQLDYSNAIYPEEGYYPDQPKEPGTDVIKDQARVYAFALGVIKVDGKNQNPLAGVTFDLYRYDEGTADTTETELKNNGANKINVSTTEEAGVYVIDSDGTATLTTDTNGKITVNGLENGKYFLVETKTNDGYNLLKNPAMVEIKVTFETTTETTTTTDENGNTTTATTVTTSKYEGAEDNGVTSITVENNKGFELPTTGGMGTILFTAAGIVLIAGAAVLFFGTKRRKDA